MGKMFWNNIAVELVAKKAMQDAAERAMEVVGQSSAKLAARKTGAMRGSARIEVQEDKVSLTYGGISAPYALIQHEMNPPGYTYANPTTKGTEPQYVRKPFETMIVNNPEFFKGMESYVKAALRSTP